MLGQLIYVLLLLSLAIVQKPSWVLRPRWVSRLSAKQGIFWDGLAIRSRSTGFLRPEVQLSWLSLHVNRLGLQAVSGPGKMSVTLDFRHLPPWISQIGEIQVAAVGVSLRPATAPQEKQGTESGGIAIPPWLRGAQIGRIELQVARWSTPDDQGGALLRHFQANPGDKSPWRWELQASEARHHGWARLTGQSASHTLYGPWQLRLDARASNVARQISSVRLRACKLSLSGSSRLIMRCPVQMNARLPGIRTIPKLHFSNRVQAVFSAEVHSRDLLDTNQRIQLRSELKLGPILPLAAARNVGRVVGNIQVAGNFVPSDPVRKWKLDSNLKLTLWIGRFHHLVDFLSSSKYAIPAPFNALKGSILVEATGAISFEHAKIPLLLRTRLHSPNEDFNLDATGTLDVPRLEPVLHPRLELALTLTKVRIPLPHFELGSLPQLVPDSRVTALARPGQQAGRAPPTTRLDYHVTIRTGAQPIRIQTNLARSLVPIRMNLSLDSKQKPSGTVQVESFPLDFYRRNATLQSFQVNLTPKTRKITGLIRIDYTGYTIFVKLFGTIGSPEYAFTSNPPLSDSDVISVLLFGQTSEDLDSAETQSVGNVRSAVAARALDLASLYLLASTPIESVGYDPQSGTVSMRFRLASGTSLNVTEGQQELQSVGIRQRIGSHWSITTEVGNPADPTDKSVSALFEWRHRY